MIENNNTVSKDLEKALQALTQAKQRVANEKKSRTRADSRLSAGLSGGRKRFNKDLMET